MKAWLGMAVGSLVAGAMFSAVGCGGTEDPICDVQQGGQTVEGVPVVYCVTTLG